MLDRDGQAPAASQPVAYGAEQGKLLLGEGDILGRGGVGHGKMGKSAADLNAGQTRDVEQGFNGLLGPVCLESQPGHAGIQRKMYVDWLALCGGCLGKQLGCLAVINRDRDVMADDGRHVGHVYIAQDQDGRADARRRAAPRPHRRSPPPK